MRLSYTLPRTGERIFPLVQLITTRPHFGGLRWWFLHTLIVQGRLGPKRVAKLYLPLGASTSAAATATA